MKCFIFQGPIALRSKVWEHFKEKVGDKTTVKCDLCPNIYKYSGSTTCIKNHLKNAHYIDVDKEKEKANEAGCSSAGDQRRQMTIQESLGAPVKMSLDEVKDVDKAKLDFTLPNQLNIFQYSIIGFDKAKQCFYLAKYCCISCIPLYMNFDKAKYDLPCQIL